MAGFLICTASLKAEGETTLNKQPEIIPYGNGNDVIMNQEWPAKLSNEPSSTIEVVCVAN